MSIKLCNRKINACIFDADGVLLDSMTIWKDLGARYIKKQGLIPEEGLGGILFSMSMEEGAEYLASHYDLDLSAERVLYGISKMLEDFYFYEVDLKKGAESIVRQLAEKDIRLCVATSSPQEHIKRALSRNGILGYFERIFTTSAIGQSKHRSDIYDAAAAFMGAGPEDTLVFEDSLYALKTAAEAGYLTAGVYDENGEKDAEGVKNSCDIYIRNMENISLIV